MASATLVRLGLQWTASAAAQWHSLRPNISAKSRSLHACAPCEACHAQDARRHQTQDAHNVKAATRPGNASRRCELAGGALVVRGMECINFEELPHFSFEVHGTSSVRIHDQPALVSIKGLLSLSVTGSGRPCLEIDSELVIKQ